MKINKKLLNRIVNENFEKGFELVSNDYSGRNYWRKGHTTLVAEKWGCEGAGVDKDEHYHTKKEVLKVIELELLDQIEMLASGEWDLNYDEEYFQDIVKTIAALIIA